MNWEKTCQDYFEQMIAKIPVFMRGIARDKVAQKAEANAQKDNRPQVEIKDMVDAFFSETPFGFHGPMKSDMEEIGLDYAQYGHQ